MPALSESIAALPPLQRRMAEAWLTRFEENWHDQKLRECMRALPAQSSLRRPLLLAMIERDLAHLWEKGKQSNVESYLKDFPELGGPEEVPVELIAAEYSARQQHGGADLAEFAERFPSRIDDLYVLLKPGVFEDNGTAPPKPSEDEATERRLRLLRTPANLEFDDPVAEQRMRLIGGAISEPAMNGTPLPEDTIPAPIVTAAPRGKSVLPSSRPQTSAAPKALDRYQIEHRLGTSGKGTIYEGLDSTLDRRVAIQIQSFNGPDADAERNQFHNEARAIGGLFHPSLCPVVDGGQMEGVDFLVMPFVEGERLADLMKQRPIWPARHAIDVVQKVATAVDQAHRRGVIHRDLKPSNIILTSGDTPVVVGFGQSGPRNPNSVYAAPEFAAGPDARIGPKADIYSLGAIFYQLVTGQAPLAGGQAPTFPADLDAELQGICRRALAADPEDRYLAMNEFANELSAVRPKLRPSDQMSKLALGGRGSSIRLPATAPNPPANPAFARMQELRKLSDSFVPATTTPRPGTIGPQRSATIFVMGGIAVIALVITVVVLSTRGNKRDENPWPNYVSPNANQAEKKEPEVQNPTETPEDLIRGLQSENAAEREEALNKLKLRRDADTADALALYIAQSDGLEKQPRDAALIALLSVDPLRVPQALKSAAKSEDSRVRNWTYREITRRIDTDNQAVLLPVLLGGLKDSTPDNRAIVAEQIRRQLPAQAVQDPTVVAALYSRVCDDVWGEVNNSPPNTFIHNPRADGGKNAAYEALEELAPERVGSALSVAARSSNPDVRKWAERKRKDRDK